MRTVEYRSLSGDVRILAAAAVGGIVDKLEGIEGIEPDDARPMDDGVRCVMRAGRAGRVAVLLLGRECVGEMEGAGGSNEARMDSFPSHRRVCGFHVISPTTNTVS